MIHSLYRLVIVFYLGLSLSQVAAHSSGASSRSSESVSGSGTATSGGPTSSSSGGSSSGGTFSDARLTWYDVGLYFRSFYPLLLRVDLRCSRGACGDTNVESDKVCGSKCIHS